MKLTYCHSVFSCAIRIVCRRFRKEMDIDEGNNSNSDEPTQQIRDKIGNFQTVDEFTKHGFSSIVEGIKAVNGFPSGAPRDLYCAYPSFCKIVESHSDRILGIISDVLKRQNVKGNIQRRQQDEQLELLQECNDAMIERLNSNLDDIAGIKKNPETLIVETQLGGSPANLKGGAESWNVLKRNENTRLPATARLFTAKNIARPQVNFKVAVDNSPATPFIPKIKYKPNSLKPLAVLPEYDEDGAIGSYIHPYEFELMKLTTPKELLKAIPVPKKPCTIENTPLVHVNDEQSLKNMLYDLQHVTEFAVDLEHHSYRTFQGITCLMQISTRHKDYIIDTLSLREDLHVLNEVFTNPKILKIFHGAASDIEWLQRDLALYVVNMFDTSEAAKLLGLSRLSLAYLLKNYCSVDANKTFQLADWRIRPLPEELILYARQDTHYLIYIYEVLRNELLVRSNSEANLLANAYKQSTEMCKRRYQKPKLSAESHMDIYRKSKRPFDNRQLFALKEIFSWRDKIARLEDESYGYVLPNHMMLQICETLPREMQGVLACCNPIPPLVRQHLHFLHHIVLKAREQPLVKPIIDESIVNRTVTVSSKDVDSRLYCPHDLSHNTEFRDDLPTLLGQQKSQSIEPKLDIEAKPFISVFETTPNLEDAEIQQKLSSLRKVNFVSPYDRYKAAIPFAEQQRLKDLEREASLNSSKLLCPIKEEESEKVAAKIEIKKELVDADVREPIEKGSKRRQDVDALAAPPITKKVKTQKQTVPANKIIESSCVNLEHTPEISVSKIGQDEKKDSVMSKKLANLSKGKKKRQKLLSKKTGQSSDQSVHDFSKVDYTKFKGRSAKQKNENVQSKFAGKKGRKNVNNKQFNKLFTFSANSGNIKK